MATVRKSLTITESQDHWIKTQIEKGGFANDSEYLRHLIRLDEEKNRNFLLTKAAIEEGYKSGVSSRNRTVVEILKDADERKKGKS